MKLICNPLLPNLSRPDTFSYDEAYDIHHIGALREGRAEVTASFNLGGQRPTLLFDIRWWPKRDWRPRGAEPFSGSVSLPLWFHRSSSCVLPILEEIQDNLPPEALVGYDATLDMHADTYDAQMHGPFEPPKNSPFSDTQTEIPDTEMYDDDGPHTQYPPPSNMQTDIPAIEMVEEHAPPTQYTPAANANTQMYDEHGPPSQYFPHVGMSTDNHLIEMNNEYRPPTQSPPVSNTQRDIPVAESYLGHRASASVAPRGNTQLDPIDLSTSETGADEETSYTEEIRGSRKISRETETAGRYSGARFTL
ncbi:hypothetical protein IMZ48_25545 [Candidatus Bathyarchaeota archaeon]|nr:hypothetical protein [Candidatus Bathyarchaeota archaeon]